MYGGYGSSPLEILACQAMVAGLVYLDEFTYSATWQAGSPTALLPAPNGDKTVNIQINSDSDFIAQEYNICTDLETANLFGGFPDFLIQITRSGSGRNIMDQPQRTANFCGNYSLSPEVPSANNPGRLSITSLYQGNSTIGVRLINRSTEAPFRVDFAMKGFKVFYQTNSAGQTGNRQQIFHAL